MAARTISGQQWPEGTTVKVYLAAAWVDPARAPSGPALATDVVSGGSVTFGGLTEDVRYVAWASPRGVAFLIPSVANYQPDRQRIVALEDGSEGSARVLTWSVPDLAYFPVAYRDDDSVPREFVGPVDPSTIEGITVAYGDRWTPTEEPVA